MNSLLNVKNLSLSVEGNRLLKNISFNIKEGEIFVLVGESGSGKSLTSLAIMRLLPDAISVSGGDIVFKGQSLFALGEYQMQKLRGKSIGMIFQEPMSALNPVMGVGEQVAEVIRLHLKRKEREIKQKVIALFEEVALKEPKERYEWYPHQLSGGQKQRVMIAMALACEPDVLIADEPTTALDVTIQAQVLTLLKQIQASRGLSILFITHDMGVVAQMANRVAVMREGEIVEQACVNDFFASPKHPYSQQLLADAKVAKEKKQEALLSSPLLEVNNLKVHFPIKKGFFGKKVGVVKAVDGVSLAIAKGKTLALVGESGSGKSTIGKAILSLICATSGSICFENQELRGASAKRLKPYRQKIQVIFQDPFSALNPRMSITQILREGMVSLGIESSEEKIVDLLKKVGLEAAHKERYPHEFSGGQRQRIAIARTLAVEPELIICDEPTSALDVSLKAEILRLLQSLQEQTGMSYLFITHDLSIVPTIADEVAVMREGKIVEQGGVKEVMENPKHAYTQALLNAVPKLP